MGKIIHDNETFKIEKGKRVLIGGCFDILHPGHFEFIKRSREQGDTLILLLESDENIHKLKGKGHPVNSQALRANNLISESAVDYVVLLNNPESDTYYYNLVKSIRPAIIAVTENDPLIEVKKDQASGVNGKVVSVMKRDTRYSTSSLIKQKKI